MKSGAVHPRGRDVAEGLAGPFQMPQSSSHCGARAEARAPFSFFWFDMAATDQQIADAARDSLARILATDTAEWSESQRRQRALEIDRLTSVISEFDAKASRSAGRQIIHPMKRVNV